MRTVKGSVKKERLMKIYFDQKSKHENVTMRDEFNIAA